MSEAIKKMLAERAKVAAQVSAISHREVKDFYTATYRALVDRIFAKIDLAAPYINDGCPSDKWPPSFRLKAVFWATMSGPNPHHDRVALGFIETMLERARKRWVANVHPNPWLEGFSPETPKSSSSPSTEVIE
jgi:hypothetical protein